MPAVPFSTRLIGWGSEALGTFVLLVAGISSIVLGFSAGPLSTALGSDATRLLFVVACWGGTVTLLVYSPVGRASGAHVNPAVTLAFLVEGRVRPGDAVAFVAAQLLGGFAAMALLAAAWGERLAAVGTGVTHPGAAFGPAAAFASELLTTGALVFLIFVFLGHERLVPFTGLAAGLFIAVGARATAAISGTSLNPVRSLAPAVAARDFADLWIYLVAPAAGALLGVAAHRLTARPRPACAKLFHPEDDPGCLHCGGRDDGASAE